MYGRVHANLRNLPLLLLPGLQFQIKFTKFNIVSNVLSSKADTGDVFRFLDTTLHVRHEIPSPTIHLAHAKALEKANARFDMNSVVLKTLTFGAVVKNASIDNAMLGNAFCSQCFETSFSRNHRSLTPATSGISVSTTS